jgi:hypothetical protein
LTVVLTGLGSAALIAAKLYVQHMFAQVAASTVTAQQPKDPGSSQLPVTKALILALGLGMLASSANAGYLLSKADSGRMSLSLPSGTGLYLLPIEGFQVGATLPQPTYGLSFNEDLVFGGQTVVNGVKNLAPYFGVGASLYLDTAGVINGTGPLVALGGFNILGPDLDLIGSGNGTGLVPDVAFTYNFATGESKVTGGLTVFSGLFPGVAQQLAGN